MSGAKVTGEEKVTDAMLQAAMKKAIELGVYRAHDDTDTHVKNWASMTAILQAALDAA